MQAKQRYEICICKLSHFKITRASVLFFWKIYESEKFFYFCFHHIFKSENFRFPVSTKTRDLSKLHPWNCCPTSSGCRRGSKVHVRSLNCLLQRFSWLHTIHHDIWFSLDFSRGCEVCSWGQRNSLEYEIFSGEWSRYLQFFTFWYKLCLHGHWQKQCPAVFRSWCIYRLLYIP